jgi:DNA-binding NarL/FixJ family response regulator
LRTTALASTHTDKQKKSMGKNLKPLIKVAVVEDHPEFRDALCQTLGQSPCIELLEPCKDLPDGLRLLAQVCPDVLLVDLGLPSGSGLALIHEARRRWGTRCTTAVLTVMGNEEHLLTAVGAGAKGYLFKSDRAADWLHTVQALALGQSPLHANLARSFLERTVATPVKSGSSSLPAPRDGQTYALLQHIAAGYTCAEAATKLELPLSEAGQKLRRVYEQFFKRGPEVSSRELELLTLLNKGHSFKKCADLMGVSETTTKTHAARAYQKLGATNLQAALYEARAASLIA